MKVGTYYYPDQWPREQWERDFDRMAAMGMKIVHLAEFAWGTIEPSEGKYQLDWLADCLEMAAKRKLDVILCTPTAVLPVWMVDKHPEILITGHRFGGRRHGNHLLPALQDYSRKVVQAMVDRFADHPSVIGWQIDNELGADFDQSPTTHQAFRDWLKSKYHTLDRLNEAWGTIFWNTFYTDWKQILFSESRDPKYGNPHQCQDSSRFWSWSFAQYVKLQADVLKPRIGKRWITTNFITLHLDCDPADMADSLSLFSWDAYPAGGYETNPKDENFRIAGHSMMGLNHDHMASFNGRWALMELQPGTINWSGVPLLVYPGAIRLWIWTAFAHGAEFVTTYRFRQPRFGREQFHHGLILPDGVTASPGGREFSQVSTEVQRLDPAKATPATRSIDSDNTVGLMLDFDQYWAMVIQPQVRRWTFADFMLKWYSAIARLGLNVRIVNPHREWPTDLKMLVAPAIQLMDEKLAKRFEDYASAGGNLVLTCRTGLMNRDGHFWEGPTSAPIVPLIGASIEAYDSLPDGANGQVEIIDGGKHSWNIWGDLLYAAEDTKVLAKYTDMFYAGAVAATQRKLGQGTVTYSGVNADYSYHNALMEKLAKQFKLATKVLQDRVHVYQRGAYTICLNYNDKPVAAPAPKGAKFVVGSAKIEAAGVAVWE